MHQEILNNPVFISACLLIIVLVLKYIIAKIMLNRARNKKRDRRNTYYNVKHFINFIAVLALLYVWSAEIQNFALSIAAFAVAIVLATREFIQCVIGFFYLVTTRPFRIGDWIKVGDIVGEVAETDWIKTTLHEIDMRSYQFSRKTVYIPNNKLITSSIVNMNYVKRFVTHRFDIVRKESFNPYPFFDTLLAKAKEYCSEFKEVAARYNSIIELKLDAQISGPDPEIIFSTSDIGEFKASITLFCPREEALNLEHKITQDFMELWYEASQGANTK